MKTFFHALWAGLLLLTIFSVVTAIAATNAVPSTASDHHTFSVGPNDLKPHQCNGINLTNLVVGAGAISGTSGNDLILGSSLPDIIDGAGGDDCILGGGGIDMLTGNTGSDVCLGGPELDGFVTCEGEYQ